MAENAPGRRYRLGMSIVEAIEMFADPIRAEQWFVKQRWPDGVECPKCQSKNIQERASRKPQPFRCRTCRYNFSVKSDTIMHGSNLPVKAWGLALHIGIASLKGPSSMRLYRDLKVTQKTAWYLGHRIRTAWEYDKDLFANPAEVDETYIGGKEKNKHNARSLDTEDQMAKVAANLASKRLHYKELIV